MLNCTKNKDFIAIFAPSLWLIMRLGRDRIAILVSLICNLSIFSQEFSSLKYIDINDGLSNSSVNTMIQDKNGFMWFGTYDGLNRFDGYDFKVYRNTVGNLYSVGSNYINCLANDSYNTLWIGGANGIYILRPGDNKFYSAVYENNDSVINDFVSDIKEISRGVLLAATQKNGLIEFSKDNIRGRQILLEANGAKKRNYDVSCIESQKDKTKCFVFVNSVGLCEYNLITKRLKLLHNKLKQANALLVSDKTVWIGTDEGLYKYQNENLSPELIGKKVIVTSLLKDKKNRIWIGTDGAGVFYADARDNDKLTYYSLLKSKNIKKIYEDHSDTLWFCTLRSGIARLNTTTTGFSHIYYQGGQTDIPENNFILSFAEDQQNNLWIGTDGGGLRYWNRKTNQYQIYRKSLAAPYRISGDYIPSITIDKQQNVWIATWEGGVSCIKKNSGEIKEYHFYSSQPKNHEKNTWLIFTDSQGTVWATTFRNGSLYRYYPKEDEFRIFFNKESDFLCMTESGKGKIWAGDLTGLTQIDLNTNKIYFYYLGFQVRSIARDTDNSLWIGTVEEGLLHFNTKTKKYRRYTTDNGLPSNTILTIVADKEGHLWLSTYNGLSRFDIKKGVFRNFSVSDGLQSNQFSYNAALQLKTGEIAFGGINGFNLFSPAKISNARKINRLVVSGISVNDSAIENFPGFLKKTKNKIESIRLPYSYNNIAIDFSNLDYSTTDKTLYRYYLNGWDKRWNFLGKDHKAIFSRLPEGLYTLKVSITDEYGNWTEPRDLVSIKILPPWYRSIWAYILYAALLFLSILYYRKYKLRKAKLLYEVKLARLESKKEKEFAENQLSTFTYISHEFRTPLTLIINPIKDSIKKAKEGKMVADDLELAHHNAKRLLSLVDQIVLSHEADQKEIPLNISKINIQELCKEVYRCFFYQAQVKNINYTLHISPGISEIWGDREKLEIALFNVLANALKYTAKGNVNIDVSEDQHYVTILISDTGIGIPVDKIVQIFDKFYRIPTRKDEVIGFGMGLYIARSFVEKHKGSIICTSEMRKGSSFQIRLRKGTRHLEDIKNDTLKNSPKKNAVKLLNELHQTKLPDTDQIPKIIPAEEMIVLKKSLIIIESDKEIRNYIENLFTENYIVYMTETCAEALVMMKDYLPDLVICDMNRATEGIEFCKQIRSTEELFHIPVILLTENNDPNLKLEAISNGADDFIPKPFDSGMLVAKVETILKNRGQLRKYFLDSITLKESPNKVPKEYRGFLKQCIEIIEENMDKEDFSVKDLSSRMGMSHSGLYKKIREISGQSISTFIRSVRLRKAAMLLLTEDINISEAAIRVGISDSKYFRRQFKALFGMIPSEYIKRYKNTFSKELNIIQKP